MIYETANLLGGRHVGSAGNWVSSTRFIEQDSFLLILLVFERWEGGFCVI